MMTGMIRPSFACGWVCALNCLQNSMMFTPCWPSAGPTGGAGLALPAGICSFTWPVTFFIGFSLRGSSEPWALPRSQAGDKPPRYDDALRLLHLHEVQLDRGRPAEDRHEDAELALVGLHLLHRAVEVREGAVDDPHLIALLELDPRLGLERALRDLGREARHLGVRDARDIPRVLGAADEPGHLGRRLDHVPGGVG